MGGGVAVFDYNNDGWEDIWITGGNKRDVLYKNEGDGTFTEVGFPAGLARSHMITWYIKSHSMRMSTGPDWKSWANGNLALNTTGGI